MAEYFTCFNLVMPLPSKEAQAYALDLANRGDRVQMGDEEPGNFPKELLDVIEDWYFDAQAQEVENKPSLWLHSCDGGVDAVCPFIQHLLKKFDPEGRVAVEWSNHCSKPRTDAYGGGAAIITARKIKTISTHEWLRKHAA